MPYLIIASAGKKGRGIFTTKNIKANTIIEVAPVIVLSAKERKTIEETKLFHYVFEWGRSKKQACIALGYASLYNHNYSSNCEYDMDYDKRTITIKTVKTIKKGDELSINYNAEPNDTTPVWFDAEDD